MITLKGNTNASVEALVGQIADEFTQRFKRGEQPSIEEYEQRYPEIAPLLRGVLRSLGLLGRPDVKAELADSDPASKTDLGDFHLIREIGRGGMGIVFEADQISLKRKVAVKVLPFAATLDRRQLQRFKNEAAAAARLHHDHIVPVFCIGEVGDVHFYAMELIQGQSLAVLIEEMRRQADLKVGDPQRTRLDISDSAAVLDPAKETMPMAALTSEGAGQSPAFFAAAARLGLEAAMALDYAHQMDVLHRDIKPGNLLVNADCKLWVTDFGLAQMRSDARLTLTGELVGTVRYMSPEQALGKRVVVDERTDVYSLGATLYELLTLEPVFAGNDRQELLRQIAFDDPRPPRSLVRNMPRDLETIVMTALAKAPANRYASARAMARDLRRYLDGEPIEARPEGPLRWLGRKTRRHAAAVLAGLATTIAAVVLLLFFLHLRRPSAQELENMRQQQALAVHTQDLDHKKKITLIGERGWPAYFRWKTSEALAKIDEAPDETFSVQDWEHGLLELLPDPRLERYCFRAEVRHERQSNQQCKVGIYFLHSELQEGKAVTHFHCNVAFNDLVDADPPGANGGHKGNVVGLEIHRQPSGGLTHYQSAVVQNAHRIFVPAKPVGALGPWRSLAVEVRPESIKVFWEGNCIATTPRAILMMSARPLSAPPDRPLPANSPQFAPRGALGLFANQGVASFRNVTVEPINNDN